jgi:hypothetical protein
MGHDDGPVVVERQMATGSERLETRSDLFDIRPDRSRQRFDAWSPTRIRNHV